MQAHAKVCIISATLMALSACAGEAHEESGPTPRTVASNEPPNTPKGGATGSVLGRAGASSGGSAGNALGAGGTSGSVAPGTGGTGGSTAGSGGANGSATGGATTGHGGSAGAGGSAGKNSTATTDCPSVTHVRINGACVVRVTEFDVAKKPTRIVTGSDGRLWVDDEANNQLVQVDEHGNATDRLDVGASSAPRTLAGGLNDAVVWYTDAQAQALVKVTNDRQKTLYPLGFLPAGIALGSSGEVYLTEFNRAVYRVHPGKDTTQYPCEPSSLIAVSSDKNVWFQEGALLGRLIPDVEKQDFPMTDSFATDLCAGPDSAIWFTDGALHQIGRMGLDGVLTRTYDLPIASGPLRIITGPDGALWFTERGANMIGRITSNGATLTHYPVPSANGDLDSLAVGQDRNIWFTETSGKVGRLIVDTIP